MFSYSNTIPDIPDEKYPSFSQQVLVYSLDNKKHTIAWYDYDIQSWQFLANEHIGLFMWRYFDKKEDYPK